MRRLDLKDAQKLSDLHQRCFPQVSWQADFFESALKGAAQGILVEKENKVIGFLLANVVERESDVLTICVDPSYRRQGIASQVFTEFFKEFDIQICTLEVNNKNQAARNLYLNLGFQECGERPGYYQQGTFLPENGVVYRYFSKG